MPTLKIDGQEITVDRGTTILQAANELGIDIPTFCYHPGLSIAANCRMCLVDTNKAPKPLPACHATCMDGMEVYTDTEAVREVRQAVLEFILLNHPVDCPICDQAGECVLQDHYFKYSAQPSRLFHRKRHKAKAKPLGPDVMLDAERCILCTRCVRFCDEVAKSGQLTVLNRGDRSEISTFPGVQLDNPYAQNTVDICPVGALTSRSFRFKTRVWFMQGVQSVCNGCSRGCKVRVDVFENTPRRLKPLYNPTVNNWWMCDAGRGAVEGWFKGRALAPSFVDSDGKRRPADVNTGLEKVADAIAQAGGYGNVSVILSSGMTNEDAYLWGKLVKGPLSGVTVYIGGVVDGDEDDILIKADKNANRTGLSAILDGLGVASTPLSAFSAAGVGTVVIVGDDHALQDGNDGLLAALHSVPRRVVLGAFNTPVQQLATVFLPTRTFWEKDGSFTNFDGIVQRIRRATRAAATCKSEGWFAMKLSQRFGDHVAYSSPSSIFDALAAEVGGWRGLSHAALGDYGAPLGAAGASGDVGSAGLAEGIAGQSDGTTAAPEAS